MQKAKIANRDEFIEFTDFVNACKYVISLYKKEIESQFESELNENNQVLSLYEQNITAGITTDQNGNSIQEHIERLNKDKDFIRECWTNDKSRYICCLRSDSGKIVENNNFTSRLIEIDRDTKQFKYDIIEIDYYDIESIEKSIDELKQELNIEHTTLEFKDYFTCSEEDYLKVVAYITNEVRITKHINVTMATISFALKSEPYFNFENQTQYFNALKTKFGKVGGRAKFSERLTEYHTMYQNIIEKHKSALP